MHPLNIRPYYFAYDNDAALPVDNGVESNSTESQGSANETYRATRRPQDDIVPNVIVRVRDKCSRVGSPQPQPSPTSRRQTERGDESTSVFQQGSPNDDAVPNVIVRRGPRNGWAAQEQRTLQTGGAEALEDVHRPQLSSPTRSTQLLEKEFREGQPLAQWTPPPALMGCHSAISLGSRCPGDDDAIEGSPSHSPHRSEVPSLNATQLAQECSEGDTLPDSKSTPKRKMVGYEAIGEFYWADAAASSFPAQRGAELATPSSPLPSASTHLTLSPSNALRVDPTTTVAIGHDGVQRFNCNGIMLPLPTSPQATPPISTLRPLSAVSNSIQSAPRVSPTASVASTPKSRCSELGSVELSPVLPPNAIAPFSIANHMKQTQERNGGKSECTTPSSVTEAESASSAAPHSSRSPSHFWQHHSAYAAATGEVNASYVLPAAVSAASGSNINAVPLSLSFSSSVSNGRATCKSPTGPTPKSQQSRMLVQVGSPHVQQPPPHKQQRRKGKV